MLSSRACFRFLDPLRLPKFLCSICQRSTGRSSPISWLCTGASALNTPHRLFRGRPVYSNSIFVDGVCSALFPQMDVWPRCQSVGPDKRSRTAKNQNHLLTRGTYCRVNGNLRFPLTITYHG
jgi:hypothetical protein